MSVQEVFSGVRRWGVAIGDCSDSLRQMPANSVHCCVTSPPYYGLRSYLPKDHPDKAREIGLEETPEAYIERMVGVFRDVRRVLRDDGVLWVNVGDSYSSGGNGLGTGKHLTNVGSHIPAKKAPPGYKPKDRIGIPHMLAFALRADGWFFRDEIIWAKRNPMPSSTQDRTTAAHEFVFMFSKKARYYYDNEAIREGSKVYHRKGTKGGHHLTQQDGYKGLAGGTLKRDPDEPYGFARDITTVGRNKRSVWPLSSAPYKGSHYATFPPKLVEPCILAGTSAAGCCRECGTPLVRVVVKTVIRRERPNQFTSYRDVNGQPDQTKQGVRNETTGWQQTCKCEPSDPVACVVLDPFVGSGTTLEVATTHNRRAVGCDLDERNLKLIRQRMELVQPSFMAGV